MAGMYMKIEGMDPTGAATLKLNGEDGWIAIKSYKWGGTRHVEMDIGNSNNSDKGVVNLSEVTVTKEIDGSSGDLQSFLYAPGKEGKKVQFMLTKPEKDGTGVLVFYQVQIDNARLSGFYVEATDGGNVENLVFSYVQINQKVNTEDAKGELEEGGLVSFSIPDGEMVSGSKG
ncbi:type VI secretion system tube protein Hcp [Parashewanella spongiae]|uniref:Type VI secretion system tube protein Hcp n=1 Tax=Parashewanella spongiae TaxID=342950 RepID=A0A3A6U1J1_9GAMM|nr:type VI secretion system tube protein Hcp [Parashewanella spongiae]MCL1076800.1 type VI secretion system tube protein Hcp [Parashewanella spongiae]RJY19276.1 type VI secretion system tube protein Hcp [Parashewanella spongiae]